MSAPAFLFLATLAVAALSAWNWSKPPRAAALAAAGSLALAAWALFSPIDAPFSVIGLAVKLPARWSLLGRGFVLDEGARPMIAFLYLATAFLTAPSFLAGTTRAAPALAVMLTGIVAASLMVTPFVYAALFIELAALGSGMMLVSRGYPSSAGALRLLSLYTFAMMGMLATGWLLDRVGVTASTPELANVATMLLILLGSGATGKPALNGLCDLHLAERRPVFRVAFSGWVPMAADGDFGISGAIVDGRRRSHRGRLNGHGRGGYATGWSLCSGIGCRRDPACRRDRGAGWLPIGIGHVGSPSGGAWASRAGAWITGNKSAMGQHARQWEDDASAGSGLSCRTTKPSGVSPVGGISWPMVSNVRVAWRHAVDELDHPDCDDIAYGHGHIVGAAPFRGPRRTSFADAVNTARATLPGRRHLPVAAAGDLPATRISMGCGNGQWAEQSGALVGCGIPWPGGARAK